MAEIEGIPLVLYCPQAKIVRYSSRDAYTCNVHVILCFLEFFRNIRCKNAGRLTLAERIFGKEYQSYREQGNILVARPDLFLQELIGTTDRESETYQEFKQRCDEYKSEIVRRILTDEYGSRSPD